MPSNCSEELGANVKFTEGRLMFPEDLHGIWGPLMQGKVMLLFLKKLESAGMAISKRNSL